MPAASALSVGTKSSNLRLRLSAHAAGSATIASKSVCCTSKPAALDHASSASTAVWSVAVPSSADEVSLEEASSPVFNFS